VENTCFYSWFVSGTASTYILGTLNVLLILGKNLQLKYKVYAFKYTTLQQRQCKLKLDIINNYPGTPAMTNNYCATTIHLNSGNSDAFLDRQKITVKT
jgi:hypothetical protein